MVLFGDWISSLREHSIEATELRTDVITAVTATFHHGLFVFAVDRIILLSLQVHVTVTSTRLLIRRGRWRWNRQIKFPSSWRNFLIAHFILTGARWWRRTIIVWR